MVWDSAWRRRLATQTISIAQDPIGSLRMWFGAEV